MIITIIRKIIVLAIGLPVVVLGIILIPLPGPGLLVSLLGLIILSLEFEWAQKHRDTIRAKLTQIINNARAR